MPKIPSEQTLVKIADASRILGIHKDTLRRWEKANKIKVIRHSNGARLYNISDLVKITPAKEPVRPAAFAPQNPKPLTTEELLKESQPFFKTDPEPEPLSQLDQIISEHHTDTGRSLRLFGGFMAFLSIITTGLLIYLKAAPQFSDQTQHKQKGTADARVLGESTVKPTVKFNANEKVTGSLVVDADINGVKLGLLPSATEATINAQGSVNLDQDLSTTSSPTFAGLTVNSPINAPGFTSSKTMTLTSPANQITFDISGIKSTITWGPTSAKTLTLPNATDTLVGKTTTDTLSNKTIKSGDSNTISGSFPDITGITSLGTVSTGTWNGTKIGIGYGGTNLTSYTKGDILYASASDTLAKLAIGTSGYVLKSDSTGVPVWGSATTDLGSGTTGTLTVASGGTGATSLTANGVLYGNGSSAVSATSAGTSGQLLLANSSAAPAFATLSGAATISSSGVLTLTYSTGQNLTTTSTPTFAGLYSNGNLGIGTTNPASALTVIGNVGIGTSGAGTALQVNGGGLFGWGTASTTLSSGAVLGANGNVGVGTTSPLSNLHVVGQCVAEGTRIRRRRKVRKNSEKLGGPDPSDDQNSGISDILNLRHSGLLSPSEFSDYIEEDIPVEDIKPDDEVLSLNDKTGQWEWHKVEATLDKGIQEVYRLETEFGKWIETTSEHPYLVRNEELFAGAGLLVESNIGQQSGNQHQTEGDSYFGVEVNKINHTFFPSFLSLNATDTSTITNPESAVNNTSLLSKTASVNSRANAATTHPAHRLTNNSDNIIENTGSTFISWDQNNTSWVKVQQLKAGQFIATSAGWEKIISITKIGRKQTYDLQIEGTHNFVGNDIIAHNTYINNGLNIGTAFTTSGIASPANGLAVSGNLGIGTTSPLYALDVSGSANITGSLTVAGSIVGTGAVGGWARDSGNGIIYTSNSTDKIGIGVTGSSSQLEILASSTNTALTLKGASSGSNNIFQVLNNAGTSTYFSVDSSGQLSGSAFQITDATNAVVGTAIAGGWTMNSNTFTYRRTITISNTSGSSLPKYYPITISLNSSDSNQVYTKSQQSSPYKDFRTAWDNSGGTITEIARNVSSFTSSSVSFTFQLSAAISASGTDTYYIYYGNSSLSSTPSTFTGNIDTWEAFEAASGWTSGDTAFIASDNSSSPASQQGTNSMKMVAMVDRIGVGSTASQTQLSANLNKHSSLITSVGGTDYVYTAGGHNGTTDVSTVSKAAITSANIGSWATTGTGQPAVSDTAITTVTAINGGTGADGTLDLSLGSASGGCSGTGLSWTAGTSTCTIATATKSTFNFTTINISSGTTLTTDGPKTTSNFVTINATGNVTVTGTINLAGKGYRGGTDRAVAGSGPGGGGSTDNSQNPGGGGGGYGGAGGGGECSTGCTSGGAAYTADDSGSGGGGSSSPVAGGNGGGGVKMISLGTITVSGTINANGSNGENATGNGKNSGGGGGSGGRIYLQGGILTVSGSLTANGGNGGDRYGSCGTYCWAGGGGGGGRITLEYSSSITTTGSTITVTGGTKGANLGGGANGSAGVSSQTTVSPYFYIIGGKTGSTPSSSVYYAAISSDSTIGAFATTTGSLPAAISGHTAVAASNSGTNYIYVIGGNNGTSDVTTVSRGTVGSTGDISSAFSTSGQGQLSTAVSDHATTSISIGGTTYVYVIGGTSSGTAQTAIYKASISSGNIGTWAATSLSLPAARYGLSAAAATVGSVNYIYIFGGKDSSGNPSSTVYRATLDSSGDITAITATAQSALPAALADHTTLAYSSGGSNYFYTLGGNTGSAPVSSVYKATLSSDMTNFNLTKTVSSVDLSNKNDLQFKWYSNSTASSLMEIAFSEDGSTWQTTTFTASSASTWETKTWDISGIAAASRDAVTRLRVKINSAPTTEVTSYIDDLDALMNAATITNTSSYARAILGSYNLAVNAQGTGLVQVNYAAGSNPAAGSGGFAVYDGTINPLFMVNSSGNVGIGTTGPGLFQVGNTGTPPLFISSSTGNLGVGTTNPLASFYVSGNAMIGYSSGAPASLANGLAVSGNLGIGTTNPGAKLTVIGNIGIGTSASGAALSVNGGGLFGWGTASTSLSSGAVLGVNGNVGVGTTSPLSNLHVVGQCVAWDSKIRIRRRRRKGYRLQGTGPDPKDPSLRGESETNDAAIFPLEVEDSSLITRNDRTDDVIDWDYLEVMIKDILPGDEALTLNEYTEGFEYQRIEKLLDMGSKGVYEVTTRSGRKIKTTGNHPYLVHLEGERVLRNKAHLRGVSTEYSSPIKDAGWVKVTNLQVGNQIAVAGQSVTGNFSRPISKYQNHGNNQQSIYNTGSNNPLISSIHFNLPFLSNQIESSKNTIAEGRLIVNKSSGFESVNIGRINIDPNQPAEIFENQPDKTNNVSLLNNLSIKDKSTILDNAFQWDTITSIEYLEYEHVYDLQISNTHNFLANDIVAHNTYINNGLNIGTAFTTSGVASPTNGLAVFGNVGIGTTSPAYKLDVIGQVNGSTGLCIAGDCKSSWTAVGGYTASNGITLSSTDFQLGGSLTRATGIDINSQNFGFLGGNVGIGNSNPDYALKVTGTGYFSSFVGIGSSLNVSGNVGIGNSLTVSSLATFNGGLTTTGLVASSFRLSTSPSSGYALISDGSGNGTWTDISSLSGSGGNIGAWTLNGSALYPDSLEYNVGIGTSSTSGARLSVMGGNVGIGTTTANSNLSVSGSAHIGGLYQGISAPANGLFVDGNVGIGATTSSNKLDVWGNSRIAGTLTLDNSLTLSSGQFLAPIGAETAGNVSYSFASDPDTGMFSSGANNLSFAVNGTERFRVTSNADIAIAAGAKIFLDGVAGNGDTYIQESPGNTMNFFAGGVKAMSITNGNVGIGTSSPTELLQIQGTGSMPVLLVTSGGNVGIGTSVTSNPLTIGIDGSTGNGAYLSTGGVWTNGSSREFKENFTALNNGEILSRISQLDILQWNYKLEDPSVRHIGPIAEDFYSIFGVGNDPRHISTIDPAGVALAGIKALIAQQASTSAILANLSISPNGTLVIPAIKAGSIILDPSIASASALLANSTSLFTLNSSSVTMSETKDININDKLAYLENRINKLESVIEEATSSTSVIPSASEESSTTLNLTPPDILLATSSATLVNLNVRSEATVAGQLAAYNLDVQNSLKSLGKTTLSDTLVAGNLTVDGTMSITGDSLNTLGILYLQNSPFSGGVDIFSGKVTINKDGQITAAAVQTNKLILGPPILGEAKIAAGGTEIGIETPAVSAKSKIFVTSQTEIDTPLFVSDKIIGAGFVVKIKFPSKADIIFDWSIIDNP